MEREFRPYANYDFQNSHYEPRGLARLQRRIATQRRCHCREAAARAEEASLASFNQTSSPKSFAFVNMPTRRLHDYR